MVVTRYGHLRYPSCFALIYHVEIRFVSFDRQASRTFRRMLYMPWMKRGRNICALSNKRFSYYSGVLSFPGSVSDSDVSHWCDRQFPIGGGPESFHGSILRLIAVYVDCLCTVARARGPRSVQLIVCQQSGCSSFS